MDDERDKNQQGEDDSNKVVADNFNPDQDAVQRGYDKRFNSTAKSLHNQESNSGSDAGIGQAQAHTNDEGNAANPNQSVDTARNQEESGGNNNWQDNTTQQSGQGGASQGKSKGSRKKGPMLALILSMLGGGSVLTLLFSPGMLIVTIKEKMIEKFNDQLSVMDDRTFIHVSKKFKGATTGVCTSKISIRCKFETISDKHLKRLEEAFVREGGKVNSEKTITGRNKITTIEYKGETIDAKNFGVKIRGDPSFKGTFLRGYNPKLAGFADSIYSKLSKKVGLLKQKNVKGTTPEEMRQDVVEAASGAAAAEADVRVSSREESCSGGDGCVDGKRTVYVDDQTGKVISKKEYDGRINGANTIQAELKARKTLNDSGGTIAKATLKGALTSTALGLGAVDSACTGYTLIRAVGFAAKWLGMLQLVRYAHLFGNTADRIKASYVPPGETAAAQTPGGSLEESKEAITPEQTEFIGNILTSVNSKGQSVGDSAGYQYAAYGYVPDMHQSDNVQAQNVSANGSRIQLTAEQQQQVELNDEVTKYVNGQLVSDNLLTNIISLVDGGGDTTSTADNVCNFVKSGWGQTIVIGAALVGAVVAFFSGGVSLGWGAAVQASVSVSISVAMAMLQPKLVDMAAGTMIGDAELKNGNRTGNAITSGFGGLNHLTSQARGIPAIKKDDFELVAKQNEETRAQYAAIDRAMLSPFDPTSPNTFMGSLVSSLMPYATKFSTVASGVSSMAQMTVSTFGGLLPNASAQNNAAQFEQCDDADYKLLSIAADPFCNIRHGMGKQTLATDPDIVATFMERNFTDPDTGQPKSSSNEYAEYIKNCMDRETSIGAYTEDNDNTGEECIQGSASNNPARDANCTSGDAGANTECRRNMFRLFYIDLSISEGMDNGEVAPNGSTKPGGAITGDARALAQQVASNPNIRFTSEKTREQLLLFSRGVEVYNACNEPMTVSKYLLGALLANATKYSILINNIGFREDRFVGCERGNYQHPKGTGVDLNDIQIIGGAGTGGEIEGPYGGDLAIVNQYATDFLAALPLNRGGVGQKNFGVNPIFPPGSVALNGSHLFDDGGEHLHIDARNRENLSDTE